MCLPRLPLLPLLPLTARRCTAAPLPLIALPFPTSPASPRTSVGASSGLSLQDANGTFRFSADTFDENFTRVSVLDARGAERMRISGGTGRMTTFDEEGFPRLTFDEDGSIRVKDGAVEAFAINKFGMQGLDAEGDALESARHASLAPLLSSMWLPLLLRLHLCYSPPTPHFPCSSPLLLLTSVLTAPAPTLLLLSSIPCAARQRHAQLRPDRW